MTIGVVLAAGISKRLGDFLDFQPKSLLEVGGESLLLRNIRLLKEAGVSQVVVVVGYKSDVVIEHLQGDIDGVKIVYNAEFEQNGSMWSVARAFQLCRKPLIVLDADIYVNSRIIENILGRKNSAIIVTPHSGSGDESVPIFKQGSLQVFSKEFNSIYSFPEYIGVSFFTYDVLKLMIQEDSRRGNKLSYDAALGICAITNSFDLDFVYVPTAKWSDFDVPQDLQRIIEIAEKQ